MSEPKKPINYQRPQCVAIVVCNEVIEDKRTNNKSLIGLFNAIHTPKLPAAHPRMYVLVSLTDGRGEQPFIFRIEGPSGKSLFQAEGKINFEDPLTVHDLVIEIVGLPIPELGEYYIGLYCGGEPMGSRRFSVVRSKEQ